MFVTDERPKMIEEATVTPSNEAISSRFSTAEA
jgi:hypothetical protein